MNLPAPDFDYSGGSYYNRPAVKPSTYGWRPALYTFLAGLAGAAQMIASLVDRLRPDGHAQSVVRNGRYMSAVIGAGVGPALLIADLHVPNRFYNMLRIFKRTSPMSIGSYVLTSFGASSFVAAAMHRLGKERSAAGRAAEAPAFVSAAGMTTYVPAMLSSTATPLWAATPGLFAVEFVTASFATGAAALALSEGATPVGARTPAMQALDRIACVATVGHAAATAAAQSEQTKHGTGEPLRSGKWAAMHKLGLALSVALPLGCYALNLFDGGNARRSRVASAGILAGTLLSRWALYEAGNESARSAREYLASTAGNNV